MQTEEQFHIQYLKDRAESLGLTFDQYMLFLIFETLDHANVLQNEMPSEGFVTPWQEAYRNQQNQNNGSSNSEGGQL